VKTSFSQIHSRTTLLEFFARTKELVRADRKKKNALEKGFGKVLKIKDRFIGGGLQISTEDTRFDELGSVSYIGFVSKKRGDLNKYH
jgi:hypothetical protein